MRRIVPLALALLLGACAHSPKTTLLTLDPVAGPARTDYRGRPLVVPAVHLPAMLDRAEYAEEAGAGEVHVDDFARWAAPLGLLARDTLVRDLTARLPAGAVLPPGAAGGAGAVTLDVTVLALGRTGEGVRMDAAWRALPGGRVREASFTVPATGAGPIAAAQAFGALLGQLADRIAADPAG